MFQLRRAAARALVQQSCRQISTPRQNNLIVAFQSHIRKQTGIRALHNSRVFFNEDASKVSPAEESGEAKPTTEEPSAEDKSYKEESIATSEVADAAGIVEQAQNLASSAASAVTGAASTAASAVTGAASTAQSVAAGTVTDSNWPGTERGVDVGEKNRIVYVGNLPFNSSWDQVLDRLRSQGKIVRERSILGADGRPKGFGFVEFETQEGADAAIRELDQTAYEGRRMVLQYHISNNKNSRTRDARSPRTPNPPNKSLFIGNMSYQMSDKDLNELFRDIKNVLDVRVAIDRRTGQPRGFAHADFIDIASAEKAKDVLAGKTVYGRQLNVDYSGARAERTNQ